MIDFDFEYYCPRSIKEAQKIIVSNKEKRKMFAGGATEFISRARMHELNPEILIDLKGIPDCITLMEQENKLIIGSAVSLNQIVDRNPFPLLTEVCRAIGSRTARNKITIGGNILSSLPYKEAILPFLLADSEAVIATSDGIEQRKINALSQLSDSEMLIQLHVDQKYAQAPYQYKRKTKQSNINYPIVTAAALLLEDDWRYAFSGVCGSPFCEEELNSAINSLPSVTEEAMGQLVAYMPKKVLNDMNASREFRIYLCRAALNQMLKERKAMS